MIKKKTTTKNIKLNPAQTRFVYLYLGSEDGKCFGNATLAYIRAYEIDTPTTKVRDEETGLEDYTQAYKTARSHASRLATNGNILKFKDNLLQKIGYTPIAIKKAFAKWAMQEKYPSVALSALDRMAKISGLLKDDNTVNIPQLEELTAHIKEIISH